MRENAVKRIAGMAHGRRRRARGRGRRAMGLGALGFALFLGAPSASAAPKQGTWVQTDTLGMNMVSHNFDNGKTTSVGDVAGLSEFVGLHYFVVDGVRLGMNLQFTELLTAPAPEQSRFATFALLPQVGWHFYGPLFAALVFTVAPWTQGGANDSNNFDLSVQGVVGAAIPIAERVNLTAAAEVPYNFLVHRTIGLTPLLGLSIRL